MLSSLKKISKPGGLPVAVLSLIAGYIDAYSFITYKTYVSFMSGNTTQTGSDIGPTNISAAMPALLAIVFFAAGVFTGIFLTYSYTRKSQRLLFALVTVILLLTIVVTQIGLLMSWVKIGLLSLAMGLMS